jgi:hypothetical protein
VFSDGLKNLPKSVRPVTEAAEKLIVTSLFTNIKEMLAVNIDSDPVSSRVQANSNKECLEFLVIGCSHASILAEQLSSMGASCQKLILNNYRASNIHIGKLEEGLKSITVNPSTVVVVQIFDNGVYMMATEEGGLIPLSKSIDGKYLCFRDLTFAPKEWQWKLFQQVAGELKSLKNNTIIFLAHYQDISRRDAATTLDTCRIEATPPSRRPWRTTCSRAGPRSRTSRSGWGSGG